jgi:hypothetical protein
MAISSLSSSVPSPTPVISQQASTPPATPVKNDGESDEAGGPSRTTPAPLPPGQGIRVDQLA